MKRITIALFSLLLLTTGCQLYANNSTAKNGAPALNSTATNSLVATAPSKQKFSDSRDYQNAFLVSGATLDSSAQKALTGFQLNKQVLPDGSTQINLRATESGYQDQQFTLAPGQQLYFVDRNLGDDSINEGNQLDDYGIIVDAQGYIVTSGR